MEKKKLKKQTKKKEKKRSGKQPKIKKMSEKKLQEKNQKQRIGRKSFRFIMKDVRCFAGEQKFEIRPLTFLVGENSTGKTTTLGCFHTLFDIFKIKFHFDFNEPPYELGSFDTIARRIVSKDQGSIKNQTFELGFSCTDPKVEYMVCFAKESKRAEPAVSHIKIKLEDMKACVSFKAEKTYYHILSLKNKGEFKKEFPKTEVPHHIFLNPYFFLELTQQNTKDKKLLKEFQKSFSNVREILPRILIDVAPVRSKPKRTYDSILHKNYDPEGVNIPTMLMRLYSQNKEEWKAFYKKLVKFGKASELFDDTDIEVYGDSVGGPFQIQFQIKGVQSNIRDTGYGISQVLPILTHLFLAPKGSRFLLQQPEVHLHPKAQAALASLFIESIKSSGRSFLIETHSDYIVNRARIEIQKGNIPPDQVSLIYLESFKDKVQVHNISFDKQGNLLNVPQGYGKFFLKESDALLGFDD
ncbi:MAG: AAA family ATPase [Bdellovibrionales bacterium]|nr:AAA family ATPase [Bdellovibrionales bacterium]